MFEHKHLDGEINRILPATASYLGNEILEMREDVGTDSKSETKGRKQYGVIGEQLVERCLPPESVGDRWSFDATDTPWWTRVNNPPHMGIIAEFNKYLGGKHRIPLNPEQNVVAYAASGEKVFLKGGKYLVTRASDSKEIIAESIPDTRRAYYA